MFKKVCGVIILGGVGYYAYLAYQDYYNAGYDTRPAMPEGAFSLSYKNGFRAILVDVPNERETRRYLGLTAEVPFYLEEAWSFCTPPTEEYASIFLEKRGNNPGQRLEGICRIEIEDERVIRGFITSVPKL